MTPLITFKIFTIVQFLLITMIPSCYVDSILGTINPLTSGITAKISGLICYVVNIVKVIFKIYNCILFLSHYSS